MALVEQSLVRQMPGTDDEPRYHMLETVREFGLERLAASGDEGERGSAMPSITCGCLPIWCRGARS